MLPQQDIQKYGGKAAILNHIRDNTSLPIPTYTLKEAGASVDSILPAFNSMKKPVIVRSSSPHEYEDFEGIFESVRDIDNEDSLSAAINKVEGSAKSERAKRYAKQHGFEISDRIHAIVQEQSDSVYCGAMMRHPNNPDLIFISYFSGRGAYSQDYSHFLFNERTQAEGDNRAFFSGGIDEKSAKFLVEQYKKIENLTDIAKGHSLFVEFGFKPFALYQARPFRKIETADFELPDYNHDEAIWSDFVFGITPPEGLVLPVIRSFGVGNGVKVVKTLAERFSGSGGRSIQFNGRDRILEMELTNYAMCVEFGEDYRLEEMVARRMESWHMESEKHLQGNPYCLMISDAQRDTYDTDLSVPNMKSLVIGQVESFLVHNLMRLFKQADVTVGIPVLLLDNFYQNTESLSDKIKIISNGKEGIVLKASVSEN